MNEEPVWENLIIPIKLYIGIIKIRTKVTIGTEAWRRLYKLLIEVGLGEQLARTAVDAVYAWVQRAF